MVSVTLVAWLSQRAPPIVVLCLVEDNTYTIISYTIYSYTKLYLFSDAAHCDLHKHVLAPSRSQCNWEHIAQLALNPKLQHKMPSLPSTLCDAAWHLPDRSRMLSLLLKAHLLFAKWAAKGVGLFATFWQAQPLSFCNDIDIFDVIGLCNLLYTAVFSRRR